MKLPIPVKVIEQISSHIHSEFSHLDTKYQQRLIKKCLELWMLIYSSYIEQNNKNIKKEIMNAYVNIHKEKFKTFYVKINKNLINYNILLKILQLAHTIEINDTYSSGRFPKSYRIIEDCLDSLTVDIEIDISRIFTNAKTKESYIKLYPDFKTLIEQVYKSSIDIENYFIFLDTNIGIRLRDKLQYNYIKKRYLTLSKIYSLKIQAIKYNLKLLWFTVTKEGRFYSSVSNLSHLATDFLLINKRKTMKIDARNSQPLLLSAFINNEKYSNDTTAGLFYDVMAKQMNITRDEFKAYSYRFIFFSDSNISGKWSIALEEVYPGIVEQINTIKKNEKLWSKLQRLESKIWVTVAKSLFLCSLLRHDEIIFNVEFEDEVRLALLKEYKKNKLNVTLVSK